MSATATPWAQAIASAENPFQMAIGRYARAPIAFCREVLNVEPDPWQIQAFRAIASGHTRISIRSSHGVGKTALAAWTTCWFANTRAPFKIAITAPTSPQLFDALYPELCKWFGRLPAGWRELWVSNGGSHHPEVGPGMFYYRPHVAA